MSRSTKNEDWTARALNVVKRIARRNSTFTTDDVWEKLGEDRPAEPRALGSVMRTAVSSNICRSSGGYRQSRRPESHKRPVLVWRSAIAS
jgi:hypothetical protein